MRERERERRLICFFLYILDVPIFVSKPHFLDADESYRENVSGLSNPDPKIHDSYLCVEPVSVSNIY